MYLKNTKVRQSASLKLVRRKPDAHKGQSLQSLLREDNLQFGCHNRKGPILQTNQPKPRKMGMLRKNIIISLVYIHTIWSQSDDTY